MDRVTPIPHSGPLTRGDLEQLRGGHDSARYELLDGSVLVTPSPGRWHQTALLNLVLLLNDGLPDGLVLLFAPFDVVLAEDTVLQPDLLVARRTDLTDRDLPAAPVLAVEVLSPSTRRIDLGLKFERYLRAGCPSYWVVDPVEPSLSAWRLRDGHYRLVAEVTGEEVARLSDPFPVQIRPADLVRD